MATERLTAVELDRETAGWRAGGSPSTYGQSRADESAILSLFRLLRRNVWIVLLSALLVAVAAYGLSTLMAKSYAATASLLFQQSPLVGQLTGFNQNNQFNTVQEEGATNVALVGSRPIAARTALEMGRGYSEKSVADAIKLEARPNTKVVDVTAEAATPEEAARLANRYVRVFLESRTRDVQRGIEQALSGLEREFAGLSPDARTGAAGKELEQRINTLRILSAVQSPNVEPIQSAQPPDEPASPRPRRNAMLGLLFGLLLGVGLAAVRQQLDQHVSDMDDLEALAHRPLLGAVPRHPALARPTQPLDLPPEVLDAFRLLEVNLRYRASDRSASVMVTSTANGEGKTVCAWHLAVTSAATGKRTLFVEADLRSGSVARRWGLAAGPGLGDVLRGRSTRAAATQRIPVAHDRGGHAHDLLALDVLTAGEAVHGASELFESPTMRDLLSECAAEYDLVVIDTSPLSQVADAMPLVRTVSGVVIVASPGATLRSSFERLQDGVEQLGAPLYGVVANAIRPGLDRPRPFG